MNITVIQYADERVGEIWEQVAPLIPAALEKAREEITQAQLLDAITIGKAQLWVGVEEGRVVAFMVTDITDYQNMRVVRVLLLAGKLSVFYSYWESLFIPWALANGAESLEAWSSEPWMTRYLRQKWGFLKCYDVSRFDLTRGA